MLISESFGKFAIRVSVYLPINEWADFLELWLLVKLQEVLRVSYIKYVDFG